MSQEKIQNPKCVGIIMDGNRRWAVERSLNTLDGHKKGSEAFGDIVREVRDSEITDAIFYAFSTENWGRSEKEVKYLMNLLDKVIEKLLKDTKEDKVRVRVIGETERLSDKAQKLIVELEEKSAEYETTIWVAISYGGRAEIIEAVNEAVEKGEKVTEESFANLLWTAEMPDPDLIIRTSGEQRLSNFLPWQSVYSELFFTDVYWPDFGKEEFWGILEEYGERKRRKGK